MNKVKAIFAAALFVTAFGVAACNTVEGAGQDVKATGKVIEKTADQAKP